MDTSVEKKNKQVAEAIRRSWFATKLVILFLLAISLQFIFEHSEEVIENVAMPHKMQQGILKAGSWFNTPFRFIPRPLEARYAALVSISDKSEGRLSGPCVTRSFLAKLLPAINTARPALIVVDIALVGEESSDSCSTDAQETKDLVSAIDLVARTTPMAIGQASLALTELPTDRATQLRDEGFGENDLLLRTPMPLNSETKNVFFGLIRLNQHFDRVPVVWFAHQDDTSGAKPVPALGLVAAEMYRSTFPNGLRRLQSLEAARYHPVAALLPQSDFAVVNAIEVMCPAPPINHNWKSCPDPAVSSDGVSAKLHGRVVVVGVSDNSRDLWDTPVGQVAGYVLQANYIEALLDARAYRPVGFWLTFWLSLLWLILVELPFWALKKQIIKGLLFSVLVTIIILFLAKYVALVNFGLYISLFAPSVLLVGVWLLHVIAGRSEEQRD